MNILYIGSSGELSLRPLKKLLSSGYHVAAVGVNDPITIGGKLIALENETLALAAEQSDIPLIDLSQTTASILSECTKYSIDLILMSCYNRRLPDEIIKSASKGCFNMHPSLLPSYRGPEPIFWQMKEASEVGVSWHSVIRKLDAGKLLDQKKVILADGDDYRAICGRLADAGTELMLTCLKNLADGKQTQTEQDEGSASYHAYPVKQDFVLDTRLTAQQAYNFMCATQVFSHSYLYQVAHRQYQLIKALDYDNNIALDSAQIQENRLFIPCYEGVLIAAYTDKMP